MPTKKQFPDEALGKTKIEFPPVSEGGSVVSSGFTLYMASAADELPAWGMVRMRDHKLREFWPTEVNLAGAIATICQRNAIFEMEMEGPEQLVRATKFMLGNAISGSGERGWIPFINAWSQDFYTQDNGAFMEFIRKENSPTSPIVGLAHLDAEACTRTGNPEYPVLYRDLDGKVHKMPWWSVCATAEFPSPIQRMNGVGHCAVTRVLRASQIMRDLAIFKHEKVSGRFERAIHFVGGVSKAEIQDARTREQTNADNEGLTRFIAPLIIASLDPEKPVTHVQVDLASLPDGFDLDQELKWYITELALALGEDYQTLAPLAGGNLGTSTQSEVLHRKSRMKGSAIFMRMIQDIFWMWSVIPSSVEFKFVESDMDLEVQKARLREVRARERAVRIQSGEITLSAARQLAIESDDLEEEHMALIEADEAEMQAQEEELRKREEELATNRANSSVNRSANNPDQRAVNNPRGREAAPHKPGRPSLFGRRRGIQGNPNAG